VDDASLVGSALLASIDCTWLVMSALIETLAKYKTALVGPEITPPNGD
jgi:hypothetical protein